MKYKVNGYLKRTRKLEESAVLGTFGEAYSLSGRMLATNKFKVITILRDDEGASHPDNAGKFFLDRIVK